MLYLLMLSIIIFLLFILKNKSIDLTSPIPFTWITWGIGLVACILNVFNLYTPISLVSYIYIFLFLFLITIFFHLGRKIGVNQRELIEYDYKKILISFNLLFLAVLLIYIITILKLGLPPTFSGGDRSSYYLSNGGELIYLLIYPCFFLGFFVIKKLKLIKPIFIQLVILFLIILSRGNKMGVFSILIIFCIFFLKKTNLTKSLIILGTILLVFWASTYIYTKNISDLSALKLQKIASTGFNLPDQYYVFYDPLVYITSNIYNFNGLVNSGLGGIGYGSTSFKGIAQIINIVFPNISLKMNSDLFLMNSTLGTQLFNTFSGLGLLYFDYGILISLILFIVIAFVTGFLYQRIYYYNNNSLLGLFFYYVLYQTLALSFFTFYMGNLEVLSNICIIMFIDYMCRKK